MMMVVYFHDRKSSSYDGSKEAILVFIQISVENAQCCSLNWPMRAAVSHRSNESTMHIVVLANTEICKASNRVLLVLSIAK